MLLLRFARCRVASARGTGFRKGDLILWSLPCGSGRQVGFRWHRFSNFDSKLVIFVCCVKVVGGKAPCQRYHGRGWSSTGRSSGRSLWMAKQVCRVFGFQGFMHPKSLAQRGRGVHEALNLFRKKEPLSHRVQQAGRNRNLDPVRKHAATTTLHSSSYSRSFPLSLAAFSHPSHVRFGIVLQGTVPFCRARSPAPSRPPYSIPHLETVALLHSLNEQPDRLSARKRQTRRRRWTAARTKVCRTHFA